MSSADAPTVSAWKFATRALGHRNYRLFFGGQSISLIGTFLTRAAVLWVVWKLGSSAWVLGVVGFAGQLPMFLLAPVAGALVDRWNRHRVLVITQALLMCVSLSYAILSFTRLLDVGSIIALSVAQGLINSFDMPSRQAFVVEMVNDRADLPNAIALNSSMVHTARLIGPTVGGVLIALFGASWCFLIDGISFIAVIASLLAMRVAPRPADRRAGHVWRDLKEGFVYAFGFAPIRAMLMLLALVSLMSVSYQQLIPIFANELRPDSPQVMGILMGASGLGALCGAIFLATRHSVLGLGKVIGLAAALLGAGLIGFGSSHWLGLSLAMMAIAGFGMIVQAASTNTLLQTITDDDKRARVMSIFGMSFLGVAPFGSLLAGWLASVRSIGPARTLWFAGTMCILGSALYSLKLPTLRKLVRPIYVKRGIIPEVAEGMEAAANLSIPPER